jgi:hypothetical protein
VIQIVPADITFSQGREALACVRLTRRGMLRWYAACCNTPIGNTPATRKLPFVGLARACLECAAPTVTASFGPVRHCSFIGGAIGQPKPEPFGRAGLVFWLIRNRLRARFTGGFRDNPFFDTGAVRPIVTPKVLSPAERERLGGVSAQAA